MTHRNDCQSKDGKDEEERVSDEAIMHEGKPLTFPVYYTVCKSCGRESMTPEQIRRSDAALEQAKQVPKHEMLGQMPTSGLEPSL